MFYHTSPGILLYVLRALTVALTVSFKWVSFNVVHGVCQTEMQDVNDLRQRLIDLWPGVEQSVIDDSCALSEKLSQNMVNI